MENSLDVSIIIVNYNTKDITKNCLKSIFEQTKGVSFEVIVSDNGSSDGSADMIRAEFPQAVLIENNANLGFGAANNRGLKIARGKYVFFLNSDTVLLNNAVKIFFDYWESSPEKERLGALGCNLVDERGKTTHSYGMLPTYKNIFRSLANGFLAQYGIKKIFCFFFRNTGCVSEFYGEVGYITGADNFLLNNGDAVFDELFFMYFEETDLQLKLERKNLKRLLINGPKIIHFGGRSSKEGESLYSYDFSKKSSMFFWASCIKYAQKNLNSKRKLYLLKKCLLFVYSLPRNKSAYNEFKEMIS